MQSLYQLLIATFTVQLIAIFEPSCVRPLINKYILGNFLGEKDRTDIPTVEKKIFLSTWIDNSHMLAYMLHHKKIIVVETLN